MKKLTLSISAMLMIATSQAQTNTSTASQSWSLFKPLLAATNWTVAPYATYAPKAPTKIGGGVLAIYNVNNYVGAGVGVDWLGKFNLFSGNVEIKVPIHPLSFMNSQWAKDFVAAPIVLAGLATPLGGAKQDNGGLTTIIGTGLSFSITKAWGGQINAGAVYADWGNAGPYSVKHYYAFIAYKRGF